MEIAIPVFDRLTALDAVGPFEVMSRLPGATVRMVAHEPGPVTTDNRMLSLTAEAAFAEVPEPEIIVVPGGIGTRVLLEDDEILGWIRRAHEHTRWTTSVCTGALLLAAAGLLEGTDATTHWASMELLAELGANPVSERVVERGKIITAAGVSSGIDMALTLAARIAGDDVAKAIQLSIEYDPEPPFDSGSVAKAPPHIVELVRRAEDAEDAAARSARAG